MRYVLMGVSGCGKTSVGMALAARSGVDFVDGDDLHPKANVAKMSRGAALSDADRAPWLKDVGRRLAQGALPTIIGCSALKRMYRDLIRSEVSQPVHFMHLAASRKVLAARVADRADHFMPASLLDSQFAALEPLGEKELGCEIDISQPLNDVIRQAETYLKETLE
ncbi:gluconokinase [bacterium]|nr:gluconokinase [bacterium]